MREGKHKNVLFLNEPLFCFIEPGAEGAQRKELAFLNERVNGLTGGEPLAAHFRGLRHPNRFTAFRRSQSPQTGFTIVVRTTERVSET